MWCIVGDFNAVRYPSERKDIGLEQHSKVEMERFNEFIDNCHLHDVPAMGRR